MAPLSSTFTTRNLLLFAFSAACFGFSAAQARAADLSDDLTGVVCMTVMPDCDEEGNLIGDLANPESPCFHYYENICLRQKLDEVLNENQSCTEELRASIQQAKQQARKTKTKVRCNRK